MPKKFRFRRSKSSIPTEELSTGRPSGTFVYVNRLRHGRWFGAIAVAVLILLGTGVFLLLRDRDPDKPKVVVTEEGIRLRKLNDQQLEDEVQKLIFKKKFKSAEQLINYQDKAASSKLRMMLVATYTQQGKYDDAVRLLLEQEKQNPNDWWIARTIGDVYRAKGDKQQALAYYNKALDLVKKAKGVANRDDEIHFLEANIKEVEGQQ